MKIIKSLTEFRNLSADLVLTIGNFDGVHAGHHFILKEMKRVNPGKKLVVLTYEPHPQIHLQGITHNYLLTTRDEKFTLLKDLGIDYIWEINFSSDLSETDAKSFFDRYIFKIPNLKALYLGYDFRIGMNKSTKFEDVKVWAESKNISAIQGESFIVNQQTVSSSLIRKNLDAGELEKANRLLGHYHFAKGQVIHGKGRGKTIGIPTVNLAFSQIKKLPPKGVYLSEILWQDRKYHSITNIGTNPTFNEYDMKIETHILDFSEDVYGEELQVNFIKFVRPEIKFDSVQALTSQINSDIQKAREFFGKN